VTRVSLRCDGEVSGCVILAFLHRLLGWILRGGDADAALFVDRVFSDFADSVGSIQKSKQGTEAHFIENKNYLSCALVARGSVCHPAGAS
jgi:hypothetical protein